LINNSFANSLAGFIHSGKNRENIEKLQKIRILFQESGKYAKKKLFWNFKNYNTKAY
jgi:hypothetical protein